MTRTHRDVPYEGAYCLYRLFTPDGGLLYVGATNNFRSRMSQHRGSQMWWPDVDESRTSVEWFDSPQLVATAELRAITTEDPPWNRAGRSAAMSRYSHGAHSVGPRTVATEFDKRITVGATALRAQLALMDLHIETSDDLNVAMAAQAIGKLAERIMCDAVGNERATGHTWQEIGDAFSTTRQGAHKRFGKTIPIDG